MHCGLSHFHENFAIFDVFTRFSPFRSILSGFANGMSSLNEQCSVFRSNPHTENGRQIGRSLHAWHYSKEDIVRLTASRQDGISYEDELKLRQKSCRFLHDMVNNLTHSKGDHLATGVAAVLINRFFKFHSFKMFDYRDIAAACLFLSGKNEDSPRKLKYIVTCWWNLKFPFTKTFSSEQQFFSACDLIVQLENVVLMTIAFDMNVDLPHQHILKIMHQIERSGKYKEIVKSAYYMATEILMITDWSIRYPCTYIAAACVNIAAYFQDIEIEKIAPIDIQSRWYRMEDDTMKPSDLREMTNEFMEIFRNPDVRYGSLRRLDTTNKIQVLERSPNAYESASSSQSISACPAPPPAPILNPKKIDIDDYKERNRNNSGGASSSTQRQSFLPDMKKELAKKPKINEPFHVTKERRSQSPSSSSSSSHQHSHQHSHHHHHHNGQGDVERHRHRSNGHGDHQKHYSSNHQSTSYSSSSGSHHQRHSNHTSNGNGSHHHYHHEKRAQLGYSNEFELSEKRPKNEHYSTKSTNESSSSSIHYKSQTTITDTLNGGSSSSSITMSAYAAATNSLKTGKGLNGSTAASKPQSTYQQMVAEMNKSKSAAVTSSMDPSPPTISPPFTISAVLPPPPPYPSTFSNDDMEDGELR